MMIVFLLLLAFLPLATLGVVASIYFRYSEHKSVVDSAERARQEAQERQDRLMEALCRKANIDLILPLAKPERLEPAEGWFDKKPPKVELKISQKEK